MPQAQYSTIRMHYILLNSISSIVYAKRVHANAQFVRILCVFCATVDVADCLPWHRTSRCVDVDCDMDITLRETFHDDAMPSVHHAIVAVTTSIMYTFMTQRSNFLTATNSFVVVSMWIERSQNRSHYLSFGLSSCHAYLSHSLVIQLNLFPMRILYPEITLQNIVLISFRRTCSSFFLSCLHSIMKNRFIAADEPFSAS